MYFSQAEEALALVEQSTISEQNLPKPVFLSKT